MAHSKNIRKGLVVALLGAIGFLCAVVVTVGPASAARLIVQTVSGSGTPPPLPGTVVIENINEVAQAASSSSSKARITVLSYDMANGVSRREVAKAKAAGNCMTIGAGTKVPGFWNSGRNAAGQLFWFWDTRITEVCKIDGVWRKVGPHNCGNLVRFKMPKSHVVRGIIVMVRSFGRYHATVTARASAEAHASCGSASASASAIGSVSGATRMQARGNARLLASVKAVAIASAHATASVHCATPPTIVVTTPGQTITVPTTTVTVPSTTTVETTTTTTTTTRQVSHTCNLAVSQSKADEFSISASVGADTNPTSVTINWGDGTSSNETAGAHTYPEPAPSGAEGAGDHYTVSASASFSDEAGSVGCSPKVSVFIPAPPPPQTVTTTTNGTTTVVTTTNEGPPPPP